MAPKRDEDKCQEHLAQAEEALVCPDPQLPGLLQELGAQLHQDGNSGPQLPLFRHSAGWTRAPGDRWGRKKRGEGGERASLIRD